MKYEEAAKLWGARKLDDSGISYDSISNVRFDTYSSVGCPTCGVETEYEATVWYLKDGTKRHKDYDFYGLDQILQELFAVSGG